MSDRPKSVLPFAHLHGHTGLGSIWDALHMPDKHMDAAYDAGIDAMAITEHGNCNSVAYAINHREKMIKDGRPIKYIIGSEAYYVPDIPKWREDYEKYKSLKKVRKTEEKEVGLVEDSAVIVNEEDLLGGVVRGRSHLVVLAQNQEGLYNLYRLISQANKKENFYRYPRIDFNMLREYNKGLIISSACISGFLSLIYLRNKDKSEEERTDLVRKEVVRFMEVFGDRFYGEVQWNSIKEQHDVNQLLINLSSELGFKLISTTDSHFPKKADWKSREIYKRLGWSGKNWKPDHVSNELPDNIEDMSCQLYIKNGDQVFESYKVYSREVGVNYDDDLIRQTITNTCDIAFNQIENYEPDKTVRLPKFVVPKGETPEHALSRLAIEGLKNLGLDKKKEYVDRLKREIKVIHKRKFSQYFLTTKAIVDFAGRKTLVGVGRGSGSGSLLSYCLGITQVDPLRWGLQFERFLSAEGTSYPDIDVDYQDPMELKDELAKEWGENVVIPVSNFTTLQLKSLVKDVAKFYDISYQEVNEVTSKMMFEAIPAAKREHDITAGVYNPTFEEVERFSDTFSRFLRKYPNLSEHIEALSGQIRSVSRNASGTIIGEDLDQYMPLINSKGVMQTPWAEGQTIRLLEPMGFIKFDILGLASLRMMRQAIYLILKNHKGIKDPTFEDIKDFYNKNLHPDVIDFDDQKVYDEVFRGGKFHNVFQFQETSVQKFCLNAKPKCLEDITAITSIFRPAALSMNVDERYIGVRNGEETVEYIHPLLEEVLGNTYGQVVYQEQVSSIVHKLGKNVSLEEGNQLRKLLVKKGAKKDEEKKERIYKKYLAGCVEKGIEEDKAQALWKSFEKFNTYGFCKSHGVSYSIISFQTAHLLTYFPAEWACALLEKDTDMDGKKERAIMSVGHMGFDIEKADINSSTGIWELSKTKENVIVQSLASIKGLGDKAITEIVNNRPYKTVEDLIFNPNIDYSKFNKKHLGLFVLSRVLDSLMDERFKNLNHFYLSLCDPRPATPEHLRQNIEMYSGVKDFTTEEKIAFLIDFTGIFPLKQVISDRLLEQLRRRGCPPISRYDEKLGLSWGIVRDLESRKTAKGKLYYVATLVDDNYATTKVKCWGVSPRDALFLNRPYIVKTKYDQTWGHSTSGKLAFNWKLVG